MTFTIITKQGEKTFANKELVTISSKEGCDCRISFGFDYMLTIEFNKNTGKYSILNQFNCPYFLFKGQPLPQRLEVDKMCKLMVKDSDEFIGIKVLESAGNTKITPETMTEQDLKELYGNDVNAAARLKIEKRKAELEEARVAIIKQISYSINDLRSKISMNSKSGILLHIGLFVASLILAFGVANYLTGLPLKDAGSIIQMPVNMKLVLMYSLIIYGVGLIFKQGVYLNFQNKSNELSVSNAAAEKTMLILGILFYGAIYLINLLYYLAPGSMTFFAIAMSLFFTGTCATLAYACGYFKSNKVELTKELNRYEYREDFEILTKEYQGWIERFLNNLSSVKIRNLKNKLFTHQIWAAFETLAGFITAPFLAYAVSNTLAMCFPEAAGWIRIQSVRISPVFLALATFMIIFAFFAFVNGFLCNRKIQASNVLKNDGFSNYATHGVEIYGLQGIRKLESEMFRSFLIGCCIIFIEFSMNISYFMQEMGDGLTGMFLSVLAALVPTSLLIGETYMLSKTKFNISVCDDVIDKMDRD